MLTVMQRLNYPSVSRSHPPTYRRPPACPLLAAARTPELARDLVKLRIHLRNKYHRQLAAWRAEQGAKPDGETRTIQELVRQGTGREGGTVQEGRKSDWAMLGSADAA